MNTDWNRFWDKVDFVGMNACWGWTGAHLIKGKRGTFWMDGRMVVAPKASLILHGVSVPDGTFVCHHCDNPNCVNPLHLFVGTNKDNLIDSSNKGRLPPQQKTHCKNGHEFTEENTRKRTVGNSRVCMECMKVYRRKYELRRRAEEG